METNGHVIGKVRVAHGRVVPINLMWYIVAEDAMWIEEAILARLLPLTA